MTNEELASLEPIIAQAWDQWDHQRRLHYAQQAQAAAGAGRPPDGQPLGEVAPPPPPHTYPAAVELGDAQTTAQPFPPPDPNQHSMPQANDSRALFHRSLLTPSLCLIPHSIIAPTSLVPASIVVPTPSSTSSAPSPVTSGSASLTAVAPAPFHVSVLVSQPPSQHQPPPWF
ncbi:hypothetical protein F5148DRAFT_1316370 [Russula earlei]|uniref:Uncharacterized protein n=1 Tax=Russula earlei TaxID=71964 RepID=A0ACC0U3G1_9AGAM|nr:hypothetical protein F5148DRAFT_1316370 [Russula earlei]